MRFDIAKPKAPLMSLLVVLILAVEVVVISSGVASDIHAGRHLPNPAKVAAFVAGTAAFAAIVAWFGQRAMTYSSSMRASRRTQEAGARGEDAFFVASASLVAEGVRGIAMGLARPAGLLTITATGVAFNAAEAASQSPTEIGWATLRALRFRPTFDYFGLLRLTTLDGTVVAVLIRDDCRRVFETLAKVRPSSDD